MKKIFKTALAVAAIAAVGLAQASIVTFDSVAAAPVTIDALYAPLLGDGDQLHQSGFYFAPLSNSASALPGDLVGTMVDGSDVANTCYNLSCPTNNSTTFFASLNDGVAAIGTDSGNAFRLRSIDASFVGNDAATFPATTLLLRLQGVKLGGGTLTQTFQLPGTSGGSFKFATYTANSTFADTQFTQLFFFGLACNASSSCSAFNSNTAQFALDNINVTEVPEPAAWAVSGLGLLLAAGVTRRRRAPTTAASAAV
ncbi:MAG: NF038120 family PEP-CTERM protein [Microbacteriaceae bacterium]|nr:NF038120 family PEP-CTERM protein [Burkholderiaceae bacterium]